MANQLVPFHLKFRIPQAFFNNGKVFDTYQRVSFSYSARFDELFVIMPGNRTVSSLAPVAAHSKLRPVYIAPAPAVPSSVCFIQQTGTLLISKYEDANQNGTVSFYISALSRDVQNWLQQSELKLDLLVERDACDSTTLCALPESTVLFGAVLTRSLSLLKLAPGHQIELLHRINTPELYTCLSATMLDGQVLVALGLSDSDSVSVSRLANNRLEELSRLQLMKMSECNVLWSGEHLLLAEMTWAELKNRYAQNIVELDTSRTPLARGPVLLHDAASDAWCTDGESLILWNWKALEVRGYKMM